MLALARFAEAEACPSCDLVTMNLIAINQQVYPLFGVVKQGINMNTRLTQPERGKQRGFPLENVGQVA